MNDDRPTMARCPDGGKVCFRKAEAEQKRKFLERLGREGYLRTYQCPSCDYWHLTKVFKQELYKKRDNFFKKDERYPRRRR